MRKLITIMALVLMTLIAPTAGAQGIFDTYFAKAQAFAHDFPSEKVHLHFDNSSYYQGDTIWYKAYVVNDADNKPSLISKPLYVEFVDQLGNVMDRQIVKLHNGEGEGQISLANTFFTGFYEVRAYTKWMLSFGPNPPYFSRVIPVYRRPLSTSDASRSIATYRMDDSMKQRPKQKVRKLSVRFFPEGGNLIEGVASTVGFETLSEDSGWVDISGFILDENGKKSIPVATIHDGIGSFTVKPGSKPVQVAMTFQGKDYKFTLPQAQPKGYVLSAITRDSLIEVSIKRNAQTTPEQLALFVFSHSTPCTYVPIDFGDKLQRNVRILTSDLPGGVTRLALVNANGNTLADRFCFVYPNNTLNLQAQADNKLYAPYRKANCVLRLTDGSGQPVRDASVSVAVRDGVDTDYREYEDNIFTDLLLTSELKGYINRPGYYFTDRSAGRRHMLDNLLLVRGWRKYDLDEAMGKKTFDPKYLPEPNLNLYGHIDSWYGKSQAGIGITVLAQRDTLYVTGSTRADSLGNFVIPLDDFYGKMESLIQTRRDNKKFNRNALVSLYRTFEPDMRVLDFSETNPVWDEPADTTALEQSIDSLATVLKGDSVHMISEIVVKAKFKRKSLLKDTETFERDIIGYYNIRQFIDKMRDEGKFVPDDMAWLMHTVNPNIDRDGLRYRVDSLKYSANGKDISLPFLKGCNDMIETALLYRDKTGLKSLNFDKNFRVKETDMVDIFANNRTADVDTISQTQLRRMAVRCDFTMNERWNPSGVFAPTHGIRRTIIQGYNEPAQFYSPQYADISVLDVPDDTRRTLYWNPSARTDANGEVHIELYNGRNMSYLNVSAEAIADGRPAAVTYMSYPKEQK